MCSVCVCVLDVLCALYVVDVCIVYILSVLCALYVLNGMIFFDNCFAL